jgi:hypothetical protein
MGGPGLAGVFGCGGGPAVLSGDADDFGQGDGHVDRGVGGGFGAGPASGTSAQEVGEGVDAALADGPFVVRGYGVLDGGVDQGPGEGGVRAVHDGPELAVAVAEVPGPDLPQPGSSLTGLFFGVVAGLVLVAGVAVVGFGRRGQVAAHPLAEPVSDLPGRE